MANCSFAGASDEEIALTTRLPMHDVARRFHVPSMKASNDVIHWERDVFSLRFFRQSRRLEWNGLLLWMNGGVWNGEDGKAWVAEADVHSLLEPLLNPAMRFEDGSRFVVMLDPGHGGDDPGAVVVGAPPEKAVVMDLAWRLKALLEKQGVRVVMTRDRDVTVSLAERSRIALRQQASLFVSIHANQASNASAAGIETFVLPVAGFPPTATGIPDFNAYPGNQFDPESTQLAVAVHQALVDSTGANDRGIKRARFEVLRNAPCPAILVEVGFLSNAQELQRLLDPSYRDQLAQGMAQGILNHVRDVTSLARFGYERFVLND